MATRKPKPPPPKVRDEDEDDDEQEDKPPAPPPIVVPVAAGQCLVSEGLIAGLVAQARTDEDARAKSTAATFFGLSEGSKSQAQALAQVNGLYLAALALVASHQVEIAKRDSKIAEMERQSEDARLQREKVDADLKSRAMDLRETELKIQGLIQMVSPLVDSGGRLLLGLLAQKVMSGAPGGLPPGAPTNGPPQEVWVEHVGAERWRDALVSMLSTLDAQGCAEARALVAACAGSIGLMPQQTSVAPAEIAHGVAQTIHAKGAGEALTEFMGLTASAFTSAASAPPQQQQNGAASARN